MTYNEFMDKANELGFFANYGTSELTVHHDDDCDLMDDRSKECSCDPDIYLFIDGKRIDLVIDGELMTIMSYAYKL